MGTAIRQRTLFRVQIYAFGLYVDPEGARASLSRFPGVSAPTLEDDESYYRHLLDLDFDMTLRLVMTRTVDGDDVAEAFDEAAAQDESERSPSAYAPRRSWRFSRRWCVASPADCSHRARARSSPDESRMTPPASSISSQVRPRRR